MGGINAEYMGTHGIFESDFDCLTECWLEGFFRFQCDSPRLRLVSHHRLSATSTRRRTASVSTRTARLILLPSPKWLPSAMKPPMLLLSKTSTKRRTSTLDFSRPTSSDTDDTTSGASKKRSRGSTPSRTRFSALFVF